MRRNRRHKDIRRISLTIFTLLLSNIALAGPDPIPISANQAFDAVVTGTDPANGTVYGTGKIALVDVRTPSEFQFQGTAGKVDSLKIKGEAASQVPDNGKVRFIRSGAYLEYTIEKEPRTVPVNKVIELITVPIAVNVPCAKWNPSTTQMDPIPEQFIAGLYELADKGVEVLITMCNSGGRSTACLAKFVDEDLASRFKAFYEIDRPGQMYMHPEHKIHLAGLGGFQGSAYGGIYNGLAGHPSRNTSVFPVQGWNKGQPGGPSVSWKDTGLPVFIPETSCNLPDMPPTR